MKFCKIFGHPLFEGSPQYTPITTIRMYKLIEIRYNSPRGLSQQGVKVSFWHPGPRKIPLFRGEKTTYLLVRFF